MDKDKVYAIRGDKNWLETMTKEQIENATSSLNSKIDTNKQTLDNQLNSSYKMKTYSAFSQVPNCTNDTPMRTVAQRMPTPSVLVTYVDDKKYPGSGNGILTIKKNTTTNTAVFEFEEVGSNATYYCHFFAGDTNNWAATTVNWTRAINSGVIPQYSKIYTANSQEISISMIGSKKILVDGVIPSARNALVVSATMYNKGKTVRLPVIVNVSTNTTENKYEIYVYNPNDYDVEGLISWKIIKDETTWNA